MATACYIASYLPASYKGVPMECMEAESEHGRRGATGEFPFGEDTAYADLGRKIRKYTLKVRFVENSHVADSAALIEACESPGAGPLIHPTRGIVQAACVSLKVRDDLIEEQGVTYGDLEMVEANEWPGGLLLGGSFNVLDISGIIDVARDLFLTAYRPEAAPYFRLGAILGAAAAQINAISREYQKATSQSKDDNVSRVISDFSFIANDTTLLSNPAMVDKAISLGIGAVAKALTGDAKFQAMRRIANSAARASALPPGSAEVENSIYALVRIVSGAYLAQAGLETNFTTMSQAFDYYDVASMVLISEASVAYRACDNILFISLRRFINSFQGSLLARANMLPSLVQYKFYSSSHPLAAAYAIFNDAKRHRELEASNIVSNTGRFAPMVIGASA